MESDDLKNKNSEDNISDESEEESEAEKVKVNLRQTQGEANTCSICYENFTNLGNHRVVATYCGHLFGKKCLKKWILHATRDRRPAKCPTCNSIIHSKKSFVELYVNNILVEDVTEKEELKRLLEDEQMKNKDLELSVARLM
ncbi:hypothetical protein ROZALSC1DRAFT_28566, partial [Rozella allomycis CSF55]